MVFLWANISGIPDSLAEIIVSDESLKKKHEKLKCWPLKHVYVLFSLTFNPTAVSSPNIQYIIISLNITILANLKY